MKPGLSRPQAGHERSLGNLTQAYFRHVLKSVAFAVAKKELLESFRDRQMILYGVVLPLALYPVMFWVMIQATLVVRGFSEDTVVRVEVASSQPEHVPEIVRTSLTTPAEVEADGSYPAGYFERIESVAKQVDDESAARERVSVFEDRGPEVDAVLYFDGTDEPAQLYYDSTKGSSKMARQRVEGRLPELAGQLQDETARELGVAPESLHPLELEEHNLAAQESMGSYMLSFILPMMLVIMTVMGAFFPAVDLTAGEKERGSIETTLLLPIPKSAVHLGKILAVCATACLAAALNLFAMGLSAGHVLSMLTSGSEIQIDLPIGAFFAIAPLAVLFALFVSAVLTSLASLTKTFKEGQAMLGPVQMFFFAPAVVCAIPGIELTPALAAVPVVNVVLAFKSMLRGEFLPLEYGICSVSLILLSVLSAWFALRLLSRESVQLSSGSASIRRLISLMRSDSSSG